MLTTSSRYARTDFNLDTRIRKRYIPLLNQQRRLRHLTSVAARNIASSPQAIPNSTFFTLHQTPQDPAFFTSEMDQEILNPTWRSFEPSGFADEVNTAACYVVCRVWHVSESQPDPCCRIEWIVHFSGLVYLGEQIPKEGKKFKPNTLIFGTSEGFYGSPDCCLGLTHEYSVKEAISVDPANVRVTYSVNTVSRIQTVQRAIKQTQASAQRTRVCIQKRLVGTSSRQEQLALREHLNLQALILKLELEGQRAALQLSRKRKDDALQDLQQTRDDGSRWQHDLQSQRQVLQEKRRFYYETREMYVKTSAQLALRRKQQISDLGSILPILKDSQREGLSICGAHLPQSEDLVNLSSQDEVMVSVALGYVTQMLLMISHFLNLPLRYPMRHFGSRSSVWDLANDKMPEKVKEFPLFPRGKDRLHFSYAVYLLNKNIAQLRYFYGLNTQDLRTTLANLYSFIDLRFNIRSDPYSSLQLSSLLPTTTTTTTNKQNIELTQNALTQVQIASDPLQAINGSLELKNHQDMMAELTREIHSMTPGTPAKAQPAPTGLVTSSQMSCSLDKGLNEIKKLQHKFYDEESKPKVKPSHVFQQQQHASFPNLVAMAENGCPPSPLQISPAVEALRESLKMCSEENDQPYHEDLLDGDVSSVDTTRVSKNADKGLADSL